jgi:hypothetical protein
MLHIMSVHGIRTLLAGVVGIALLPAFGCSKKTTLPKTYPVHGKVVCTGGTKVASGAVLFQSESGSQLSASGIIAPDGSFSLSTFQVGARAPGAVEGPHTVTISLIDGKIVVLPGRYTVKPGDNEFTLNVKVDPKANAGLP